MVTKTKHLMSRLAAVDYDFDAKFVERIPPNLRTFTQLKPYLDEAFNWFFQLNYAEAELEFRERAAREFQLPRAELDRLSDYWRHLHEAERLARGLPPGEEPADAHFCYGLCLKGTGYELRPNMVGVNVAKRFDVIASRGIWPSRMAKDAFTGEVFVEVCWYDSAGGVQSSWLRRQALTEKGSLLGLNDAPIHLLNVGPVSAWLVTACQFLLPDRVKGTVARRSGWIREADGPRFIMPGVGGTEAVGPERAISGTFENWTEGLELLRRLGPGGYAALALIAQAVASPLVELSGKRNGVLGIVQKTSKGKTIVAKFALSAFSEPGDLMLNASEMTPCGFQDHAHARSGLPVFVDEMHMLIDDPLQGLSRYIYQMANGLRRVVSSKTKESWGGDRRYGNYLYAAELTVLDALQTGALYRVIEIDAPPLTSRADAVRLQTITRDNYGVAADPLIAVINARAADLPDEIEEVARELVEDVAPNLKGDDAYVIAHVQVALELLAEATGVELPAEEVGCWLAACAEQQRLNGEDKATVAFRQLIDYVCSIEWPATGEAAVPFGPTMLAWRRANGDIDINPSNEKIRELLKPFGGERFAKEWVKRGWLATQSDGGPKVKRNGVGKRVWRVPVEVIGEAASGD